jgi:predicted aconitase/predicted aconitase with swiveling domain
MKHLSGRPLIASDKGGCVIGPLLKSQVSLSFWGGIDPVSGIVIDQQHPLVGQSVTDTIFCLPSGRGSCTASQVLLELLLNDLAPKAIVLRDPDGLVAVGALVAQEIFGVSTTILCVGQEGFRQLLESDATHALVGADGSVVLTSDLSALGQAATETQTNLDASTRLDSTDPAFSDYEQDRFSKCPTEAERMALRVVFRYARILTEHPTYTPVTKAHIDGCTYIGPGGLAFVQRLVEADGRVAVPTTLNSVSTDRRRWQALGVPEDYAHKAIALGDAYLELGCQPSFTCAPYLLSNPPTLGEDLVWGESNAVVYANSVLGARTEKYADYLDICCAIAGVVPKAGVHIRENRIPEIVLDAKELFSSRLFLDDETLDMDALFPVLGHYCGSLSDGKVPILIGLEEWTSVITLDHLKAFCAAYGTTGTSPLIHIAGISPEAKNSEMTSSWVEACRDCVAVLTLEGLEETHGLLDKDRHDHSEIDLIALGNPHLSATECEKLTTYVTELGGEKRKDVRVIACISREIYDIADQSGHISPLHDFGIEMISDTCWCMLLDPPVIPANPSGSTLTNSGKYAHYGPGLTNRRFRFAGTRECIQAAVSGTLSKDEQRGRPLSWLSSRAGIQRRALSTLRTLRSVLPV